MMDFLLVNTICDPSSRKAGTCCAARAALWLVVGLTLGTATPLVAAPSADLLLPDSTRIFLSTPDLNRAVTGFEKSSLGRFWNDPKMKPFADHLRSHPELLWGRMESDLGITLSELRAVAAGEATMATVEVAKDRFASVFLVQVTGKEAQAQELITRADARLRKRGAKASRYSAAGKVLYAYQLPTADKTPKQSVYFLRDGLLCISGSVELVNSLLARWPGKEAGSLARLTAFRDAMDRCRQRAADVKPDVRWFFDPVRTMKWMHTPDPDRKGEDDPVLTARRHGLDAVRGVGGYLNFNVDGLDLLQRTSIYAPGPLQHTLGMLSLPPGNDFTPLALAPADARTYATIYLDLPNAFRHCSRLFDDLYADGTEGTFEGFLDDLRAKDGPQVDVEKDLVAYLTNRIDVIGLHSTPVTTTSEGQVLALGIRDDRRIAAAIDRLFRDDPGAKAVRVAGHPFDLWEVGESTEDQRRAGGLRLTSSGVTVVPGALLVSTNYEFLRRLLTERKSGPLAQSPAYQRAAERMEKLGGEGASLRRFSALDRNWQTSFDLLRMGKAEDSEAMLATLVLRLLASSGKGPKGAKVDFGKLPKFDEVKHHLGLGGIVGRNQENGWMLESFIAPPAFQ